jgi:hypothetical protein
MSAIPATPDFSDAFDRHWQDAQSLHLAGRLANADHLYGLAAECGLKAVMTGLNMPCDPSGVPDPPHKVHIDQLWSRFLTFANNHGGAKYAGMLSSTNPFDDWRVSQRYANQAHFTAAVASSHEAGAGAVQTCMAEARLDGVVS